MKYIVLLLFVITFYSCTHEELNPSKKPETLSELSGEWRCTRFKTEAGLQEEAPHGITVFYESGIILKSDKSFIPVRYLPLDQLWQQVSEEEMSGYVAVFDYDSLSNLLTLTIGLDSGEKIFDVQYAIESLTSDELTLRHSQNSNLILYLHRQQ